MQRSNLKMLHFVAKKEVTTKTEQIQISKFLQGLSSKGQIKNKSVRVMGLKIIDRLGTYFFK